MTEIIKWSECSEAQRDALLVEKVFNWQYIPAGRYGPHVKAGTSWLLPANGLSGITSDVGADWIAIGEERYIPRNWIPRYTTDMAAAWLVLERFHSFQMMAVPKAEHFEIDLFAGNGVEVEP